MNLETAFASLADWLAVPTAELTAYAAEDTIGGFDFDESKRVWAMGSLWEPEGKVLYALVRALGLRDLAEFGVNVGCSATHMLAALERNGAGHLSSIDAKEGTGNMVPMTLRGRWSMIYHFGIPWLEKQPDASFDLLFEDMDHGAPETTAWWLLAQRKIRPGGLVLSHDSEHFLVGADVTAGIIASGITDARHYLIDPSDCGFAIWRAPGVKVDPELPEVINTIHTQLQERAESQIGKLKEEAWVNVPAVSGVNNEELRSTGDDFDTLIHQTVDPETYSEPPAPSPKKRGRKPKARGQ